MNEKNNEKKVYGAITDPHYLSKCNILKDAVQEYELLLENGVSYWLKVTKNGRVEVVKVNKINFFKEREKAEEKVLSAIKSFLELAEKLRKLVPEQNVKNELEKK